MKNKLQQLICMLCMYFICPFSFAQQPGSVDTGFVTGWLAGAAVNKIQELPAGKFLVSGSFFTFNNSHT